MELLDNRLKFEYKYYIIMIGLQVQAIRNMEQKSNDSQQITFDMQMLQSQLNQCLQLKMLEVITKQLMPSEMNWQNTQAELNHNDAIYNLVKQYNESYQYYMDQLSKQQQSHKQLMIQKEEEHRAKINKLQRKYEQQASRNIERIATLEGRIKNIQHELQIKDNKLEQSNNKIFQLQGQIEKYEYQLCSKNTQLTYFIEQVANALQHSQAIQKQVEEKQQLMVNNFTKQMQEYSNKLQQSSQQLEKQRSMMTILSALYSLMEQSSYHIKQQSYQINQFDQTNVYDINIQSLISQTKEQNDKLISYIRQLLLHSKEQRYSYQNLSHKYVHFLKETQQKIQQYKHKTKDQQGKINELMRANGNLQGEVKDKDRENGRLLEKLQVYLEKERNSNQQYNNKVAELKQELTNKEQTIQLLESKIKEQEQKFDKHIQSLTLQIQSLKQSISTFKNVIRSHHQEQEEPFDAAIVQQMIDKTYEIRVENSKMKDIIQEYNLRLKENLKEIEQCRTKYSQIEEQNEKLKEKYQHISRELTQCQEKNILALSQKQKLQEQCSSHTKQLEQALRQLYEFKMLDRKEQLIKMQQSSNYERLEMLKLEVYVLQEIINRRNANKSDYMVQVQLISHDFEHDRDEEGNSPLATTRNRSNNERSALNNRYGNKENESIGKLVNVQRSKKEETSFIDNLNQNSQLEHLNKTCKLRLNPTQNTIKTRNQVEEMNDIINYMVNFAKGYTRNGIRKHCWLVSQGEQYIIKIQNPKNIRQKYGNFERIRSLIQKNQVYKQLVRDYQKIINHYFANWQADALEKERQMYGNVKTWESSEKENIFLGTQYSKSRTKLIDTTHLKTN